MFNEPLAVTGLTLLAAEPLSQLVRTLMRSMTYYGYRTASIYSAKAQCLWRLHMGERGLLLLPEELLIEIVKELDWYHLLAVRQTCKRLFLVSKSLPVWQNVVEREPHETLWLECPLRNYTAERLEYLFMRRKKAEERIIQGKEPHRTSIPTNCRDLREAAVHLVHGGRWLLVATRRGSLLYFDLDAQHHVAHILIPERGDDYSVGMAVDIDLTAPCLSFKVALARQNVNGSGGIVEVWQVDLILGGNKQGVGLRAEGLASFGQEINGHLQMLSLLGEQLAMTIFHHPHLLAYTIIISWRSVREPNYPKRVHRPESDGCAVRFLQPNIFVSVFDGLLTLTSRLSLPKSIPFLAIPFYDARPETLSERIVFHDSVRFLVAVGATICAIILRDQGDGHYHAETIKISNLPQIPYSTHASHSADYYAVWPMGQPLVIQRFSWDDGNDIDSPAALINVCDTDEPAFQLLDIISGRILVEDERGLALFDFAFS
ncbi:hypothetical protein BDN72DRAFT_882845, partial [Pluteus cervinus]